MLFREPQGGDPHLAEINMVPMIDVMLVLLVIFIVTAPLLTQAVNVDLPKAAATAIQVQEHVRLSIREGGELYWNGESVSPEELAQRMSDAAGRTPLPDLRVLADRRTPYEHVAKAIALASRKGLVRVAFVSLPES